jgi:hypothetical protein
LGKDDLRRLSKNAEKGHEKFIEFQGKNAEGRLNISLSFMEKTLR